MKNASSKITLLLLVAVALFFAGCATTPLHMAAERGDIKEAERLIAEGADVNARVNDWDMKDGKGPTSLSYAAVRGHKDVARLLIEKGADVYKSEQWLENLWIEGKPAIAMIDSLVIEHKIAKAKVRKEKAEEAVLKAEKEEEEALKAEKAEEAAFTEATRSYRTATVKPTLPEDARKYKVQAEFAVGKKEFERAADLYGAVLAGYPWWPEGHYNRALILGELSRYSEAIREMKRYLTLVPDGPYARTAQDKIYQWEGEIR